MEDTTTVIGIFSDRDNANEALKNLQDKAGIDSDNISVAVQQDKFGKELESYEGDEVDTASEGALEGAATGGVIGGLIGLLAGLTAFTIPGLGAILIGGPLAAALGLTGTVATTVSGAVTGALAGGLVGALVNLGVPEEEATIYERRIKEGDILLAVDVEDAETEDKVRDIMASSNAEEISSYNLAVV